MLLVKSNTYGIEITKMMIICQCVAVLVVLNVLHFESVYSKDDLKYWVAEKTTINQYNRRIIASVKNDNKRRPQAQRDKTIEYTRNRGNVQMRSKNIGNNMSQQQLQGYGSRTALRGHPQLQHQWPRVQKRIKDRRTHLSTRMTPMYLMQQTDQTVKKQEDHKHEDDEGYIWMAQLSPYAIKQQISKLAKDLPQADIAIETIGRTAEFKDIVLLKVTEKKSEIARFFRADKYADDVPEKKIVFIVHGLSVMGMNVRENSCLLSTNSLTKLLSIYFEHLDKFDIFVIPLANPDGVVAKPIYWNKNQSPQNACPGVALDRNFDVAWNSSILMSSCSQNYPGTSPFSEPETRAIRDIFHHHSHKIIAYFHVHHGSYRSQTFKGDAVLYPKGYTETTTDDDKYIDIRAEIDEAMRNASFQVLSVTMDTLYNWYGQVHGTSVDYASTVYGIPYAMELVMQQYDDSDLAIEPHELMTYNALNEIWKRVIDVIFLSIYKSTHNTDSNNL